MPTALPATTRPGARRRFQNVKQVVTEWDYTGGPLTAIGSYLKKGTVVIGGDATNENLVTSRLPNGKFGFTANSAIPSVDQPTFGILNPLAVRGGGVNLLAPGTAAQPVGDEAGPFRSVGSPPTLGVAAPGGAVVDNFALQALANGNDVPTIAPPSSSGVGGNAGRLPKYGTATDPTAINAPTATAVVVTSTGLITDNTSGDNSDTEPGNVYPIGQYSGVGSDGLATTIFGGVQPGCL